MNHPPDLTHAPRHSLVVHVAAVVLVIWACRRCSLAGEVEASSAIVRCVDACVLRQPPKLIQQCAHQCRKPARKE